MLLQQSYKTNLLAASLSPQAAVVFRIVVVACFVYREPHSSYRANSLRKFYNRQHVISSYHHHIFDNVKLTSATFNNASTRYIISPKACKRKRLIVCPKAKNNFNEITKLTVDVGPTVFRGKFCQISRASLQNSAAYRGKIVQIPRIRVGFRL